LVLRSGKVATNRVGRRRSKIPGRTACEPTYGFMQVEAAIQSSDGWFRPRELIT
jgi:hypothetical protein